MRRGRPNDPERRERIVRAALEVIRSDGVHAASYRRIAAEGGVGLGSMTYYFPDLEGLIVAAFETLRDGLEPRYAAPLREAASVSAIVDVLVAATIGATSPSGSDMRLHAELYHYAARNARAAALVRDFQEESLVVLRTRLSDDAARSVDALLAGWWSYRTFHEDQPLAEDMLRRAYQSLLSDPAAVTTHTTHEQEHHHA